MGAKRWFSLIVMILVLGIVGCQTQQVTVDGRAVIGETAVIYVEEAETNFLARIDTGARTTSIHAIDVAVEDGEKDMKKNVGKTVRFTVINGEGVRVEMGSEIVGVTTVRNAQGTEMRYAVPMVLKWGEVSKKIRVNLRDRSAMTYKLLIGRDWLSKDFLVNVDIGEHMD